MIKHLMMTIAAVTMMATAAIAGDHEGHNKAHHWSYEGSTGPAHWGEFSTTCAEGKAQSPINIVRTDVKKGNLTPIEFHYDAAANDGHTVVNNGHAIQVNVPQAYHIVVDGERFDLVQLHFHSPSEEQVDGRNLDMVAHLVHKSAKGQLAVVALLFNEGAKNAALNGIWQSMPEHAGEKRALPSLDVAALLPEDKRYYHFMGSLTTPPCSENVKWYVMQAPVSVGTEQLKQFRELYFGTNRPVQPLNGRQVIEG